jgi:phenylacetate-coenzyme A ligase PaaK-like adenylate-forming protein
MGWCWKSRSRQRRTHRYCDTYCVVLFEEDAMTLGGKVKKGLLKREIEWRREEYGKPYRDEEVHDIQLALFNESWRKMAHEIPFYRDLKRKRGIPETISSWEDFLEFFPVVRRQDIQNGGEAMASTKRKPDFYRITGGTTSSPIRLPAWSSELSYTRPDRWYARTWYDIQPDDRGFIIWGNPQLLGSGMKGLADRLRLDFFDKAAGDYRLSSYDISEGKMRDAAQRMLEHRPDYILAYSMSMDALARVNSHLGKELRSLGLKAVIGAAEGFPSQDSVRMIRELFGCPLAMEYGTVETGLIAHTHPDGTYKVFWRNYFIEAGEEGTGGGRILRVTSLYERCFPLLRYEIGDEIEPCDTGTHYGLRDFKEVRGRVSSYLVLRDGTKIHVGALKHCVGYIEGVPTYQIVRGKDVLTLSLLYEGELPQAVEDHIRARLIKVHPLLAEVRIKAVKSLEQTPAGKVPVVIDEPAEVVA